MPTNHRHWFLLVVSLGSLAAQAGAATPQVHAYAWLRRGFGGVGEFGSSVALAGDTALVVGIDRLVDSHPDSDRLYEHVLPFDRPTGIGLIESRILADNPDALRLDWSQSAIAVHGERAVVGLSTGISFFPSSRQGYVSLIDLATGEQVRQFVPSGDDRSGRFGVAVAIEDDIVLVGDSNSEGLRRDLNAAYLFNAMTGEELFKFAIENNDSFTEFGDAVALHKGRAFVSAPLDRATGTVRVFDVNTGVEMATLEPDDPHTSRFGTSIAVDNGVAVIGASGWSGEFSGSGAAYLFDVDTDTQLAMLTPSDGVRQGWFGGSVAIDDDFVLVGATNADVDGNPLGAAYLYSASTGAELAKLIPDPRGRSGSFGMSVAIENGFAIVGDGARNSAYLFDLTRFIPEPTSGVLAALACLAVASRRQKCNSPVCVR